MSWVFDSFQASALGEFVESPLHERNAAEPVRGHGYVVGGLRAVEGLYLNYLTRYDHTADAWFEEPLTPWRGPPNRPDPGAAVRGLGYMAGWQTDEHTGPWTVSYTPTPERVWRAIRQFGDPPQLSINTEAPGTRYRQFMYVLDQKIGGGNLPNFDVARFDTVAESWSWETPRPEAEREERDPLACTIDGKLYHYASGMLEDSVTVSNTYQYDPVEKTWMPRARATISTRSAAGQALDGEAYAHGGIAKIKIREGKYERIMVEAAQSYLPKTDTWRGRPFPEWQRAARRDHAAFVLPNSRGHLMYINGGLINTSVKSIASGSNDEFNAKTNVWRQRHIMHRVLFWHVGWTL